MKTSDQSCGCSKTNELVSISIKESNQKCCQSQAVKAGNSVTINRHYIIDSIQTPAGVIPRISSKLSIVDYLGAFRVRWGIRRNSYRVDPGIYAIGTPNEYSDVLVTANYKLTFDIVRKNLDGLNVWLLVLDTKGVNVWCSAGKGTFGTKELVKRIQSTSLGKIVKHKRLLLPQLGATGVAAHLVKESSGFLVIYGPVRVSDIQAFINAGYKTKKEMRRVNFDWYDRLKLVPNDIIYNIRYFLALFIVIFAFSGINSNGYSTHQAFRNIIPILKIIAAGYFSGLIFTPLFLPYIPTKIFSFKGIIIGGIISALLFLGHFLDGSLFVQCAEILFILGLSSFLAMNFTGASTYTSLAGVKKEMKIAVPVQVAMAVFSIIMFVLEITI